MGEGRKRLRTGGGQDRKLVGIIGSAWLDCLTLSLLRGADSGGGVRGEQSVREGRRDAVPSPVWSRPWSLTTAGCPSS